MKLSKINIKLDNGYNTWEKFILNVCAVKKKKKTVELFIDQSYYEIIFYYCFKCEKMINRYI